MFNIFAVRTKNREQDMGVIARLKVGAIALDVARWAADVARTVDPAAVLNVVFKAIEIERTRRGAPGAMKLSELLGWFLDQYPGASGSQTVVIGYVQAIVRLLNAVSVFRK